MAIRREKNVSADVRFKVGHAEGWRRAGDYGQANAILDGAEPHTLDEKRLVNSEKRRISRSIKTTEFVAELETKPWAGVSAPVVQWGAGLGKILPPPVGRLSLREDLNQKLCQLLGQRSYQPSAGEIEQFRKTLLAFEWAFYEEFGIECQIIETLFNRPNADAVPGTGRIRIDPRWAENAVGVLFHEVGHILYPSARSSPSDVQRDEFTADMNCGRMLGRKGIPPDKLLLALHKKRTSGDSSEFWVNFFAGLHALRGMISDPLGTKDVNSHGTHEERLTRVGQSWKFGVAEKECQPLEQRARELCAQVHDAQNLGTSNTFDGEREAIVKGLRVQERKMGQTIRFLDACPERDACYWDFKNRFLEIRELISDLSESRLSLTQDDAVTQVKEEVTQFVSNHEHELRMTDAAVSQLAKESCEQFLGPSGVKRTFVHRIEQVLLKSQLQGGYLLHLRPRNSVFVVDWDRAMKAFTFTVQDSNSKTSAA